MGVLRPKEILRAALELETKGNKREASRQFSVLSVFLRRREKFSEALTMAEWAISLSPQSARLYLQKALCLVGLSRDGEAKWAVEAFTKITLAGGKVSAYTPYLEQQLEGYPALRQIYYEEVIKLDRTGASVFLGLARALKAQNQLDGAVHILLDSFKTKEMREELLLELQEVLTRKKSKAGLEYLKKFKLGKIAEKDLVVLLGTPPEEPKKTGRTGAIAETNEVASEIPWDEKTLKSLIAQLEGNLGGNTQNYDTVRPLVQEFKARSTKVLQGDSKALMDMAIAFKEMGLMAEAKEYLSGISESDEWFWEARCLFAEIEYQDGAYIAALEIYKEVLRNISLKNEAWKNSHYMLSQILFRLGDFAQAAGFAERLAEEDQNFRSLHLLRTQIEIKLDGAGRRQKLEATTREARKK